MQAWRCRMDHPATNDMMAREDPHDDQRLNSNWKKHGSTGLHTHNVDNLSARVPNRFKWTERAGRFCLLETIRWSPIIHCLPIALQLLETVFLSKNTSSTRSEDLRKSFFYWQFILQYILHLKSNYLRMQQFLNNVPWATVYDDVISVLQKIPK